MCFLTLYKLQAAWYSERVSIPWRIIYSMIGIDKLEITICGWRMRMILEGSKIVFIKSST